MAEYRISYDTIDDVVFKSKGAMRRYLEEEQNQWAPFFEHLPEQLPSGLERYQQQSYSVEECKNALLGFVKSLENPLEFNRRSVRYQRGAPLPPPSDSLVGTLVLAFLENEDAKRATACYLAFLHGEGYRGRERSQTVELAVMGKPLLNAAPIVSVLPFNKVSSQKFAAHVRTAKNHVETLAEEVKAAQTANQEHEAEFGDFLSGEKARADRVDETILKLNARRDRQFKGWMADTEASAAQACEKIERRVQLIDLSGQRAEENRQRRFDALLDLFEKKLRLQAPVDLWAKRESQHKANAWWAMAYFVGAGLLTIVAGVTIPILAGDYIAQSFFEMSCIGKGPADADQACQRVFSAKGPLTVTGLLLVSSLMLWFVRLQYRVHLSERHLSLDAREKKAFAETYQAMIQGNQVGKDSEAIVLASLFRPTQDGIIRDDETGMDLSAAAIFARHLGKAN